MHLYCELYEKKSQTTFALLIATFKFPAILLTYFAKHGNNQVLDDPSSTYHAQGPNDKSMLVILIGYSCIKIYALILL